MLSHSSISLATIVTVVSILNKILLRMIVLEWFVVWQFLIVKKMRFYNWGINLYHYSCTSVVISIALLSATQRNLIKSNYNLLMWIDKTNSSVYNYVITHSQETNIVELFGYSKSEKIIPFS